MTKYRNINNNGKGVFLTLFEGSVYKLESDETQDSPEAWTWHTFMENPSYPF